jgi:hypothetical protein
MDTFHIETNAYRFGYVQHQPSLLPSGEEKKNRDGVPINKITVLALREGQKAELLEVSVAKAIPAFTPMEEVAFDGLEARLWQMNGRAGLSVSATGVYRRQGPKA